MDVLWEHEPNDDAFTQANGPLVSGVTYFGRFTTPADVKDYFYIQLASPQSVDIWLGNQPSGQDYDLVLRDAALTLVGYSGNVGNADESILTHPLPAGKYYIQVFNHGGGISTEAYHLWVFYPAVALTVAEDGAIQPENPPPEP
ncbi:MAG: hypothetical protein BWY25_02933 [Chloroflexi bacterium ADurb.Bin222]|nr:MAG: hypothetical protein BWY25_02933 [Chloroflexi bacterium ADurb.Bin222]